MTKYAHWVFVSIDVIQIGSFVPSLNLLSGIYSVKYKNGEFMNIEKAHIRAIHFNVLDFVIIL
jgi:hypothetical protein